MTNNLFFLSAYELASAIKQGRYGAEQVTELFLERIKRLNPGLNAYTDITAERALHKAREVDKKLQREQAVGPLAGVPFAAKNLFDIAGLSTRAGSKINRDLPPAERDSILIERLEAADAVLLGGLNMGEYAYDFTGENQHDGNCHNPWKAGHMSGGSSSGSGSATAAGLAPVSLGSDTNGSIRVPSSLCGIFGLKPTYGRLPRTGSFPFCDSLDHLGPLARSAKDLALAFDAMQGYDAGDHACVKRPVNPTVDQLDQGIDGLRIARAGGYFDSSAFPVAAEAMDQVCQILAVADDVEIPYAAEGRASAFIITNVESANLHHRRLQSRWQDFDQDTLYRFLAGSLLPASWYVQAQRVRQFYLQQVLALFTHWDIILAPATPCTAPQMGEKTLSIRGEEHALRPNLGLFTQPISAIGLPVVVVPCISSVNDMPIGVQIIAAPWREDLCLRVAHYLEQHGFQARIPGLEPA